MDTEIVETVRGKQRRVEIRKHRHFILESQYTLYDPDKGKTVSGTFSRLDEAYKAAEKYVNS